eukprot:m51a1_g9947 hypothetical protein (119) ;mRNA; r:18983-19339
MEGLAIGDDLVEESAQQPEKRAPEPPVPIVGYRVAVERLRWYADPAQQSDRGTRESRALSSAAEHYCAGRWSEALRVCEEVMRGEPSPMERKEAEDAARRCRERMQRPLQQQCASAKL